MSRSSMFPNASTALILAVLLSAGCIAFLTLQVFVRPLLWALLCGTCLYPLKKRTTKACREWILDRQRHGQTILVGGALLPFNAFDVIGRVLYDKSRLLISIGGMLQLIYLFYYYTPYLSIVNALWSTFSNIIEIWDSFSYNWFWTTLLIYTVSVAASWRNTALRSNLLTLSSALWTMLLFYVTHQMSPLARFPLVVVLCGLTVYATVNDSNNIVADYLRRVTCSNSTKKTTTKPSDVYLISLLWVCGIVYVWTSSLCLGFIPFLFVYLIIKYLGLRLFSVTYLQDIAEKSGSRLRHKIEGNEIFAAVLPKPIRSLGNLCLSLDNKLMQVMDSVMDETVSISLIFLLICSLLSATIFFTIQIQNESLYITSMLTNILNETEHPMIKQYMPDNKMLTNTMDSVLDNGYQYSREWISSKIQQITDNEEANLELEQQVLQFYDFIYYKCFSKNRTTTLLNEGKPINLYDVTDLWFMMNKTTSFNFVDFAKENIGTLMKLLESIWSLLANNINILTSLLSTSLTILHVGGMVVLNFIISIFIFLTTLYYLLATSKERYLPLEWFTLVVPSNCPKPLTQTQRYVFLFSVALEEAISSILMVTLKIAFFHGLYTWLTHTLFDVHMIFLPSALAAMFAAIPFVGTYWASLPAIMELWLIQERGISAILMLAVSLLPTVTVTSSLLSDIKGGHPYLSGLAIAGGVYWMGLEGALIGPIALCILIATINMYSVIIKEN